MVEGEQVGGKTDPLVWVAGLPFAGGVDRAAERRSCERVGSKFGGPAPWARRPFFFSSLASIEVRTQGPLDFALSSPARLILLGRCRPADLAARLLRTTPVRTPPLLPPRSFLSSLLTLDLISHPRSCLASDVDDGAPNYISHATHLFCFRKSPPTSSAQRLFRPLVHGRIQGFASASRTFMV